MMTEPIASDALDAEGRGYPRPQLRRDQWISLNGAWEFAFDPDAIWRDPAEVVWSERIRVPFTAEAPASGTRHSGFFRACWYRRRCELPPLPGSDRRLLH